ncbi:MAG: hypothetical protein KatS3mg129_0963 [Leptospiraceae bacterium]|nr:MAG: hypothetical protein KatS3mg129_0963 [Leptospiraceae bacterium]
MIVKKTQFSSRTGYRNKPRLYQYTKKTKQKHSQNFQKELFELFDAEKETEKELFSYTDNIENEFKKMFLGEVVRKDHLLSGSLSEMQRENIIKISEMFY